MTTTKESPVDTWFDEVYRRIDGMTGAEIDALPIGAIQLAGDGTVLAFNAFESNLTGFVKERVVGKNFFTKVAPCTDVKEFRGRFEDGFRRKHLYEKFRYRFLLKDRPARDVLITLFYSGRTDTGWVFVKPMD